MPHLPFGVNVVVTRADDGDVGVGGSGGESRDEAARVPPVFAGEVLPDDLPPRSSR